MPQDHLLWYSQMNISSLAYFVKQNWIKFNTITYRSSESRHAFRQKHNGCHFAGYIFKCIFLNQNHSIILIWISQKFVPSDPIDKKSTLVQAMAWRQTGVKPLPEPKLT